MPYVPKTVPKTLDNTDDSTPSQALPEIPLKSRKPRYGGVLRGMGRPGFEPETSRLKAECSTAELATLSITVRYLN